MVQPSSGEVPVSAPPRPGGVIHDIGYRRYSGPRLGTTPIARSLWVTGLLHAFGIGRSGRAKVLPAALLLLCTVPAVVLVSVMVLVGLDDGFVDYSTYPVSVMVLIVVFVAAQAPVLFSRDLRSGAIALYLARPLSTTAFALLRWAALFAAILVLIVVPVLTLYVGALAAEADVGEHTGNFLAALVGDVLLAALLATVSAVLSAYTTRRGLAIGLTIVALLVVTGFVTAVKEIALAERNDLVGELVGLFSPFSLIDGIQGELLGGNSTFTLPPDSTAMALLYLVVALAGVLGGLVLLVRRYRKEAGR